MKVDGITQKKIRRLLNGLNEKVFDEKNLIEDAVSIQELIFFCQENLIEGIPQK